MDQISQNPRLVEYVVIVGAKSPNCTGEAQKPELLCRFPQANHEDFALPADVIYFCQPQGCISRSRLQLKENPNEAFFIFTLTDNSTGKARYGICLNFYRVVEQELRAKHALVKNGYNDESAALTNNSHTQASVDGVSENGAEKGGNNNATRTLISLCIISQHRLFSAFRELLVTLRQLIEDKQSECLLKLEKRRLRVKSSVWIELFFRGSNLNSITSHSVVVDGANEIENWIRWLLRSPVPTPGHTYVELFIDAENMQRKLLLAYPNEKQLPLIDVPLFLPLALLGADLYIRLLSCILLEHKVVIQSRDLGAMTLTVLALIKSLYPLEYVFAVVPLLPNSFQSAEQLLLVPTPFLIGVSSDFFSNRRHFRMPDDVWLVNLDTRSMDIKHAILPLPNRPEPDATVLRNRLNGVLVSLGINETDTSHQLTADSRSKIADLCVKWFNAATQAIYSDVDLEIRAALVRFLGSSNLLGGYAMHTRTVRLHPRPVVAFQTAVFLKSRPTEHASSGSFTGALARTQAVEYLAEWLLTRDAAESLLVPFTDCESGMGINITNVHLKDKPHWYDEQMKSISHRVPRIDKQARANADSVVQPVDITSPERKDERNWFAKFKIVTKSRSNFNSNSSNSTGRKWFSPTLPSSFIRMATVESQQLLEETIAAVLNGRGVGFLKETIVGMLLENESRRNYVISRMDLNLDHQLDNSNDYIADVPASIAVLKGMAQLASLLLSGLEKAYYSASGSKGGVGSTFKLLEILHTHYAIIINSMNVDHLPLSEQGPYTDPAVFKRLIQRAASLRSIGSKPVNTSQSLASFREKSISSVKFYGDRQSKPAPSAECIKIDAPDGEEKMKMMTESTADSAEERLMAKTVSSGAFRYANKRLFATYRSTNSANQVYLYELLARQRSRLWDDMQFWEDLFFDTVSQERDAVGLKHQPTDVIQRYNSMNAQNRRRIELQEDSLLCSLLCNTVAFMVMMRVNVADIRHKIRRLLGRCHIGLHYSAIVNDLLENLEKLQANDVDLMAPASRLLAKQSFEVLFDCESAKSSEPALLEICDECVILRNTSGVATHRFWLDKTVEINLTPQSKFVSFVRPSNGSTCSYYFHTNQCHQLYASLKGAMHRSVQRMGV